MDHADIARSYRRRQALEALEFERGRETAIREQLETTIAELEGPGIDERVFASMDEQDAEIVRQALGEEDDSFQDELEEGWALDDGEDPVDRDELLAEIARLEGEVAESRTRQQALERYLAALDQSS